MFVLGLDIGSSSIGWCAIENSEILGTGARVFPSKQGFSGIAPHKQRQNHRATRRKNKTAKLRLKWFADTLVRRGLLPKTGNASTAEINRLIVLAQFEPILPYQFGAVLMFLAKHRGKPIRRQKVNGQKQFNVLPEKNGDWERRDATRLFSKIWRVQESWLPIQTGNPRSEIARLLFNKSKAKTDFQSKPDDDLTAQIVANQLNLVLAAIVKRFGRPQIIATEMFRQPKHEKTDTAKFPKIAGKPSSVRYELEKRLWLELPEVDPQTRRCVYSGDAIKLEQIGTDTVEIDHIIPRSRRGSNKFENLLLCTAVANREKGHLTPIRVGSWQAHLPEIIERAKVLPVAKRHRIETGSVPVAGIRYDRQLGSLTRSIWRRCSLELAKLCKNSGPEMRVLRGHETARFRELWQLDTVLQPANALQNRLDHRHHAIDAFVLAALVANLDRQELGSQLRSKLSAAIHQTVTSHRVNHGSIKADLNKFPPATMGMLAQETAYGATPFRDLFGRHYGVVRQNIATLTTPHEVSKVRDHLLREMLAANLRSKGLNQNQPAVVAALVANSALARAKRVRVLEPILNPVIVKAPDGKVLKYLKPGSNYRFDVWQLPDGKWQSEVISLANMYDSSWTSAVKQQYPTAKKRLKLHHDDCIALTCGNLTELFRVAKFCANDRLYLVPINTAGDLKARDADPTDVFKYSVKSAAGLKMREARQVRIDLLGQVFDPGFKH